jgi:hypothetical protein
VPLSHPFVERLIGTVRRECLDRTLFWTAADLELKLLEFQRYFNGHRTHAGLGGLPPEPLTGEDSGRASVSQYCWLSFAKSVAIQVALSIVLLSAAAGLLVGFRHLAALATPVVSVGPTLAMEISRSESRQSDDSENRRFFERVLGGSGSAARSERWQPPAMCRRHVHLAMCVSQLKDTRHQPRRRRRWRAPSAPQYSSCSASRSCAVG